MTRSVTNRLEAILDSTDDAIIATDLDGTISSWNGGAQRIFGYSAVDAIGKHITLIATPDRVEEMTQILKRIGRAERIDHYETVRRHREGRLIDISLTVTPIRDDADAIVGACKVARDITERKRLERAALHLSAIVNNSDDAIVSKDLNGTITSWNRGAERIFGYTAAEAVGQPISLLLPDASSDEIPSILGRIRRGEHVEHYQTKRRRKDGQIIAVSLTISPVRDLSGTIIGASKIARDVTERNRAEEALRRANRDLEQFAYSASHDLQEPLRTISIYSQLLQKKYTGQLDALADQYLSYAVESAQRMQVLVRDLLTYTKLVGAETVPPEPSDGNLALGQAKSNLDGRIRETGASIVSELLPHVLASDVHLRQLFQNLISNALKYRSEAPPQVQISVQKDGRMCEFSVKDNGIGIAPEYHEQVFGLFRRLHGPGIYPGSGIGLALCQRIVERYGGRIWVDSAAGEGATFRFTLPVAE